MKKIKELIKDIEIIEYRGDLEKEVTGIDNDSRNVKKGDIFFAVNGFTQKGSKYIPSAIENGATAVVIEADEEIDKLDIKKDITVIKVSDVRTVLGQMSKVMYNNPSSKLKVIGITGTKGKSTSTFMIKGILEAMGKKVALLGSVGGFVGNEKISNNTRTTPESFEIQKFLSKAIEMGAEFAVLEVSSQAMKTQRVVGIEFDITGFTNFSEEHISPNEHKSLEEYYSAKLSLLKQTQKNVLNIDDKEVKKAKELLKDHEMITYGINNKADYMAVEESIVLTEKKIEFEVVSEKESFDLSLVIPGRFSIYNALMAIAICKNYGATKDQIISGLKDLRVLGRLEPVPNEFGLNILLDYAHTPSSLESILLAVRAYAKGKIICAWGVGGNREKTKRPIMGELSGKLADYTILMSDQVRFEDPLQILKDIEVGVKKHTNNYKIIVDRKEGIKEAIKMTGKEDTLLIPGFGHDMYQEINGVKHPFDERKVIKEIIEELKIEGVEK